LERNAVKAIILQGWYWFSEPGFEWCRYSDLGAANLADQLPGLAWSAGSLRSWRGGCGCTPLWLLPTAAAGKAPLSAAKLTLPPWHRGLGAHSLVWFIQSEQNYLYLEVLAIYNKRASLDHFDTGLKEAAQVGVLLLWWVNTSVLGLGTEILSCSVSSGQANAAHLCQIQMNLLNLTEGCLSFSSVFSIRQTSSKQPWLDLDWQCVPYWTVSGMGKKRVLTNRNTSTCLCSSPVCTSTQDILLSLSAAVREDLDDAAGLGVSICHRLLQTCGPQTPPFYSSPRPQMGDLPALFTQVPLQRCWHCQQHTSGPVMYKLLHHTAATKLSLVSSGWCFWVILGSSISFGFM